MAISPTSPHSGASPGDGYPNVLIVDDHAANLLAMEAILQPLGYRTVKVDSGELALKQLLKQDFAVILLDVQMPGMDGFQTAEAIKAHPRTRDIPILFVTAITREATHVFKGYGLGAVDYLLKPFDADILRAKVSVFVNLYLKEEKIRAQAALLHQHELASLQRRNDERYQVLAEAMPRPMWRLQKDGTVSLSNRAWHDYSGTTERHGALFTTHHLHDDDVARVNDLWREGVGGAPTFDFEARLKKKDGTFAWHLFRGVADRVVDASARTWIVTATDNDVLKTAYETTKRLTEELRKAEHRFRSLVDNLPEVAWAAPPDGYIDFFNRRWYDFTGTSFEQVEGWGWKAAHDPALVDEVLARWRESLRTGEPFEMEYRLRAADGEYRSFLSRVRPLRDENGAVMRWFGSSADRHPRAPREQAQHGAPSRGSVEASRRDGSGAPRHAGREGRRRAARSRARKALVADVMRTAWDTVVLDKLTKIVGPKKADETLTSVLGDLGLPELVTANDLYCCAQRLIRLGGFVGVVGGILSVHAVIHGATATPADAFRS